VAADAMPITAGVLRDQRRSLALWGLALAAVTAIYTGFWPAMGDAGEIEAFVANMPEGIVQAMGYDDLASPAGYLRSTVYGLLGPALLLVFGIGAGARLIAGQEEDGTLELELTSPVSRGALLVGRLVALWVDLVVLAGVVVAVTLGLVAVLDMGIGVGAILAAGLGLLLLAIAFATVAMAVGAITGRRVVALGVAAGLAVTAFVLHAIGPTVGAAWMGAVSPFAWYLEPNPLAEGFQTGGLVALAVVAVVAAAAGLLAFDRRDLMV